MLMIFTLESRPNRSLRELYPEPVHEPCPAARCRSANPHPCLRGDGGLRAWRGADSRAQGHAAAPDAGLDLVALMAVVAVSSLWIHEIRLVGPFSPIHLLSIWVPIM